MFANAFQCGFLSIFYSIGSNPLSIWDKQVKNGHIRRIVDDDIKSLVLEVAGTNVATTYITCPIQSRMSLGVQLPFLVMIIKNLKKYFTFEIQILDDKDMRRRFRISNFQSTTKVLPFCTTMPIGLCDGWNQVHFNLADFTKRAYGSTYMETTRVQVHANVRIRRIYFSDRLYSDEDMPTEFKLFASPGAKQKDTDKKKESVSKAKEEEEKAPEKFPEEVPPLGDLEAPAEAQAAPDFAAPSPVDTGAVSEGEEEEGEFIEGLEGEPVLEPEVEPHVGEGDVTEAAPEAPAEEGAEKPAEAAAEPAAEPAEPAEGPAPEGEAPPAPAEEPATEAPTPATTEEPPTEPATTDEPASEPATPATTEPTETENESPGG